MGFDVVDIDLSPDELWEVGRRPAPPMDSISERLLSYGNRKLDEFERSSEARSISDSYVAIDCNSGSIVVGESPYIVAAKLRYINPSSIAIIVRRLKTH